MLLNTMTNEELLSAFEKDLNEITTKLDFNVRLGPLNKLRIKKTKKMDPLKRRNFLMIKVLNIRSSSNNVWRCYVYLRHKTVNYTLTTKMETPQGYQIVTKRFEKIHIFTSHFISRYKERFMHDLVDHNDQSPADFFFLKNKINLNLSECIGEVETSYQSIILEDGLGLANQLDEEGNLIKINTFLGYRELKKTQLTKIAGFVQDLLKEKKLAKWDRSKSAQLACRSLDKYLNTVVANVRKRLKDYNQHYAFAI